MKLEINNELLNKINIPADKTNQYFYGDHKMAEKKYRRSQENTNRAFSKSVHRFICFQPLLSEKKLYL